MIIISSRKFRDSQNEILRKALEEEVILTTLHYGNFRLVPLQNGEHQYKAPSIKHEVIPQVPAHRLEIQTRQITPPPTNTSSPKPAESLSQNQSLSTQQNLPVNSKRQVYVDPSLLSDEEYFRQEGIKLEEEKKGLIRKIFGHK